jgi:hypothetical protein
MFVLQLKLNFNTPRMNLFYFTIILPSKLLVYSKPPFNSALYYLRSNSPLLRVRLVLRNK